MMFFVTILYVKKRAVSISSISKLQITYDIGKYSCLFVYPIIAGEILTVYSNVISTFRR